MRQQPIDLVRRDHLLEYYAKTQRRVAEQAAITNVVCMAVTCITVLGLYAMGAGAHAGWGFLMLSGIRNVSILRPDSWGHDGWR